MWFENCLEMTEMFSFKCTKFKQFISYFNMLSTYYCTYRSLPWPIGSNYFCSSSFAICSPNFQEDREDEKVNHEHSRAEVSRIPSSEFLLKMLMVWKTKMPLWIAKYVAISLISLPSGTSSISQDWPGLRSCPFNVLCNYLSPYQLVEKFCKFQTDICWISLILK